MKDFIIPDRDFGTPAAKSKQMVTLTVDGFDVTVPEGTSVMRAAAEAGLRVIQISPARADVPDWSGAEWTPIRPGTDTALMLAMAHEILARGWEDKNFLATHCVGWDKLRAYILGESEGVAKTPEWAAPITTIPAETIRALTAEIATQPAMLTEWPLRTPRLFLGTACAGFCPLCMPCIQA